MHAPCCMHRSAGCSTSTHPPAHPHPPGQVPARGRVFQRAAGLEGQGGEEPGEHEPQGGQAGVAQVVAAGGVSFDLLLWTAIQLGQQRRVVNAGAVVAIGLVLFLHRHLVVVGTGAWRVPRRLACRSGTSAFCRGARPHHFVGKLLWRHNRCHVQGGGRVVGTQGWGERGKRGQESRVVDQLRGRTQCDPTAQALASSTALRSRQQAGMRGRSPMLIPFTASRCAQSRAFRVGSDRRHPSAQLLASPFCTASTPPYLWANSSVHGRSRGLASVAAVAGALLQGCKQSGQHEAGPCGTAAAPNSLREPHLDARPVAAVHLCIADHPQRHQHAKRHHGSRHLRAKGRECRGRWLRCLHELGPMHRIPYPCNPSTQPSTHSPPLQPA